MRTKKRAVEAAFSGRSAAELLLQKRSQQLFHHPNIPTSPEDSDLLSSSEEDSALSQTEKGVFTEIMKLKRSIPDMSDSVTPTQSLIKLPTSLPTHHRRTKSTAIVITSALEVDRSREDLGRNSLGEVSGDEMLVDSKVSEET